MKWMELKNYLAPSFMKEIDQVSEIYMTLVKEIQEGTDEDKKDEYNDLRERIIERIDELDMFYELNFDKDYINNFENGRIKLKKLLLFIPNNPLAYQQNENVKDNSITPYDNQSNQYNPLPTTSNYNELMQRGFTGQAVRSIKTTPLPTQQNDKVLKNFKKAYIQPQVQTKQMALAMKKQIKANQTTPINTSYANDFNNNTNNTLPNQHNFNKPPMYNKNLPTPSSYYNCLRQVPLHNQTQQINRSTQGHNMTYAKDDEIYSDEIYSGGRGGNHNITIPDDSMGDNYDFSNSNRQNYKQSAPTTKQRQNNPGNYYASSSQNTSNQPTRNMVSKQTYEVNSGTMFKSGDSNFSQMDEKERLNYFKAEAKFLTVSFKLNEAEYRHLMQEKGRHIMRLQHKK